MTSQKQNKLRFSLLLTVNLLFWITSWGQADSLGDDSEVSGYWRNYLMATNNQNPLQDWMTVSTGGKLFFKTRSIKGFSVAMGYYTTINTRIGNTAVRDETTLKLSRYELGNYDVADPTHHEIAYLGEAFLKYHKGDHKVTLGRQVFKSPLLNPEDGRMIPTLVQGIIYTYSKPKSLQVNLGWLSHIAPRSSNGFYSVAESIGIYPTGLNADGTPSGYKGNIQSNGIGIASISFRRKSFNIKLWEYYIENIFNSIYLESHLSGNLFGLPVDFGAQLIHQKKVDNGGNMIENQTYFTNDHSMIWGLQLITKITPETVFSLNYNHITDDGRFLFPREWGREPLFTFQKRERLEGASDVHAWMVNFTKKISLANESLLNMSIGYGQYYLQEPNEFRFNKYAMPSRWQANMDIFYHFGEKLKGLKVEYLFAWKKSLGHIPDNPNFILNKVEMQNHNLILNYAW